MWYLPWAPINDQQTQPVFIVMFPRAMSGKRSASMAWIVGSVVIHPGSRPLRLMKRIVAPVDAEKARNIAL